MPLGHTHEEKRSFLRMKINTPITLIAGDRNLSGLCKDLSGSGVGVELNEALPMGSDVTLHIAPGAVGGNALEADARVVRLDPTDGDRYLIGLEILTIR